MDQLPQQQQQRPPPPPLPLPQPIHDSEIKLPPGWMMARQPGMQRPYYYNVTTGETTWTVPPFPPPPPTTKEPEKPKKKKKKPIPGTDWFIVETPEGLLFYFHKPTKKSVWEIPDELKEPLAKMEKEALKEKEKELEKEQARLKEELEKEKLEREQKQQQQQMKRKAEEQEEEAQNGAKRVKHDQKEDVEKEEEQVEENDNQPETTEMTEEDLLYQLEGMDQAELEAMGMIPNENDEQEQTLLQQQEQQEQPPPPPQQQQLHMPPPPFPVQPPPPTEPSMPEEERIELFTQMLSEKEISPFSTWERELPKLINDERYTLIQPLSKRKNLFNNFCRVLVQEHKAKKPVTKDPEEEYMSLLKQNATAKMYWDDFRRKVKNDSRFKAIRDSKTREILFKDYIKKLRKNNDTSQMYSSKRDKQRAYMDLLKETKGIHPKMRWRDAKLLLEKDDRYHAIDSKHLREDLYRDYLDDLNKK